MRKKEQNKPKEKRSSELFNSAENIRRHWLVKSGQIQPSPLYMKWLEQKEKNRQNNRDQEDLKYKKIWDNVKLSPGQCYWHFKDNWHCLIISVYDNGFRIPYVHAWIFDNGVFAEHHGPEVTFRNEIFKTCQQYQTEESTND